MYRVWLHDVAKRPLRVSRFRVMKMTWKPISELQFPKNNAGGGDYWVTDGKEVIHVQLARRFGTPMSFYENRGGKFVMRSDVPKWAQVWCFENMEAPENFCSSGPLPRDEIEFMPTHFAEWKPSPP